MPGAGNAADARRAWLLSGGSVVASLELAETRAARRRGLLGRDGIDGALLLTRARAVHTLGMRFPLDVAFLDADGRVLRTVVMPPHRIGRPVWRARGVLEAEAGAFARWGLAPGTVVEVRCAGDERGDDERGDEGVPP